jgi:hypothetical protein
VLAVTLSKGLISMLTSVAAEDSTSSVLQKIFDVSQQLVSAAGVTLFKMDAAGTHLVVTHAADPSVLGLSLPVVSQTCICNFNALNM